jgi:hypothetical protein
MNQCLDILEAMGKQWYIGLNDQYSYKSFRGVRPINMVKPTNAFISLADVSHCSETSFVLAQLL